MNKYQKAIEVIDTLLHLMCGEEREDGYKPTMEEMSKSMDLLTDLANKADSFEWIPFTFDEEGVLNCELPDIDEFECSNCGIVLSEYQQIEIDEDDGERFFYDYRPKYCPNCGRKIID